LNTLMNLHMYKRLFYSCRRFPHPARHSFLFPQSPCCRFLHSISSCIFSLHALLGLPLFLLLFGIQSSIFFGHRSSGILWTCPYHMSLFMLIVSIISLSLCTLLLISSFRTCSNLDTPHALLRKMFIGDKNTLGRLCGGKRNALFIKFPVSLNDSPGHKMEVPSKPEHKAS